MKFAVQHGDVTEVPSDVLLLKYAQAHYGADECVAHLLVEAGICGWHDLRPSPDEYVVIDAQGVLPSRCLLMIGTPPLEGFGYEEMEHFARRANQILQDQFGSVRTVTTTVHGVGYGLDGGEALQRLIAGFTREGKGQTNRVVDQVIFLSTNERDVRMLSSTLQSLEHHQAPIARETPTPYVDVSDEYVDLDSEISEFEAAPESTPKKRAFVAMPFDEASLNVYEFGIYPAVRNCGMLCERVDEAHFTGDVMGRIRSGIESADIVIADLTGGRPNVYLEVGYSWGCGVPVILVAQKGEQLPFDVSTHRCLFYGSFSRFAVELEQLLRGVIR